MESIIQTILVAALPVVFAITLHEAAHAYAAKYFGDSTAYMLGRMSLNPIKHIDPLGTIVIPVALYFMTSGAFLFGYAKPVPVEWGNLRKPKRDMAWVALAGPAANFIMALFWMVFAIFLAAANINEEFFTRMAQIGVLANLVIFALNLFPMPPLDGGRIVTGMLPHRYAFKYAKIEPYGFFIVIGLMVVGALYYWMVPVMVFTESVLRMLTTPLLFLLR